jgi:hypothetical protein
LKEDSKPKLNKFLRNKLKKITDPTEKQRVIDEYHSSKRVKISETQEKFKLDNKPQEGRSELWDKSEWFDINDLSMNLLPDDAESLLK